VVRRARVELPPGDVRLLLPGLTHQLVDDSLRVEGSGNARARIYGVSAERIPHVQAASGEVIRAREKVTALEEEDRALEDRVKAAQGRREFVDSLRATYSRERTENMPVRNANPKEWSAMADFVAGQYELVQETLRKAEFARRELQQKLAAARAELNKLQAKGSTVTKTVAVELRTERGGLFDLEVSYLVPSASWSPLWDARLDGDSPRVELALYGQVSQSTGEDWRDVKLTVSTLQPARGIYVPELQPHYLDKQRVYPASAPPARMSRMKALAGVARDEDAMAEPTAEAHSSGEGKAEALSLERPAAEMNAQLLSASFTSPRRESVDGVGKARKAFLATFPLQAELSRTVAPRLQEQAFLTTRAVNENGAPLLAGQASIFLGEEFMGRTQLSTTPVGGEIKLAFGADDRIKVERKVIERKHETAGILSKDEVYRYRIRTTVKNLYPKAVSVTVLDQVPVSRDEVIEVKLLDGTTKPTEPADPMKPGVRTHKLELPARGEKVIELAYEVRVPRGETVAGLE
jgi:uncharacterized protein (TIGR02231 family)